jgi:hypothetical protein
MWITATVNGERIEADDVREGENLLFVLRERMGPAMAVNLLLQRWMYHSSRVSVPSSEEYRSHRVFTRGACLRCL